ncbi:ATP-binding cassette domain-containing protein (plasmid) [Rossellomorea sp. AcN35-11]|nr:ATP-binding cassette domain-containing protein [Rossellomorea aquimaris]WJV32365.1 ATP-binding cassette domain-containing protein [Rossellomorea sp. AcN35-11]
MPNSRINLWITYNLEANMEPKVKFSNVSKEYSLYGSQTEKLKDFLNFSSSRRKKQFLALNDISFEVSRGETIGVVGINGSGKSTLSNLLAQVVPPTKGSINIQGETSLVSISAGLNNQLSGLENINMKCLMHGLSKEEISDITPKIIEFAEIGDFIKQPLKTYSSGMKSRLGFAISAYTNPDIIVVDEALSVGDQTFYQKCLDKFNEFKQEGKTIFFISHSHSQVRKLSDRTMWVHFGELKEFGNSKTVIDNYESFIKWFNGLSETEKKRYKTKMLMEKKHKEIQENKSRLIKHAEEQREFPWPVVLLSIATIISGYLMFQI